MIFQYTFSQKGFTVRGLVRNVVLAFSKILLYSLDREAKNNECTDKVQINKKAERLLKEYGNSILRLAYSYMHNMSDAEDILQDTIIQYIKTNNSFENDVHEKAWLMRVAINISKNKIIYNKRRETSEIDENFFIEEEQDLKFVWDAVKSLPLKYAEVIHLFYYEGYTVLQIAEMLCKNDSTVRSLLHRGRKKLKEVLGEGYDLYG